MKRILFFSIFLISIVGCFCSCEKEEWEKESEFVDVDNNTLSGVWSHAYEIDSLVLVFEENMMREYIFNKSTDKLLSREDYGKYRLYKEVYTNGNVHNLISLSSVDSSSIYTRFTYYNLKNDILSIYRKDGYVNFKKIK